MPTKRLRTAKALHLSSIVLLGTSPVILLFTPIGVGLSWFMAFLMLHLMGSQLNCTSRMNSVLDLVKQNNEIEKAGNTV